LRMVTVTPTGAGGRGVARLSASVLIFWAMIGFPRKWGRTRD
jgi:hypothetical protein